MDRHHVSRTQRGVYVTHAASCLVGRFMRVQPHCSTAISKPLRQTHLSCIEKLCLMPTFNLCDLPQQANVHFGHSAHVRRHKM